MSLLNREVFWPPADELIEVAERIRARLGEWPAAETRWRICLTAPESPKAGDLIVAAESHDADIERLVASGAAVRRRARRPRDAASWRRTFRTGRRMVR